MEKTFVIKENTRLKGREGEGKDGRRRDSCASLLPWGNSPTGHILTILFVLFAFILDSHLEQPTEISMEETKRESNPVP